MQSIEFSDLNNKISNLETVIFGQKSANDNITSKNKFLALENDNLLLENKLLKTALYGKKSEKFKSDTQISKQDILPNLFNEAETESDKDESEPDGEADIVPVKHKKKGRKSLPKDLPRKEIVHDLTKKQKLCHCGHTMNKIGEETSEQLDYIPSSLRVLKHIRYKYACRKCHENVQIAKAPVKVINKGIASSSLLSHSLISKFEDHLPFYRQSQIWQRQDIELSDKTLCSWALKCSKLLEPLISAMKADMINSDYICSDETPLNVILSPTATNYMWIHHSGNRDKRAVIFDYSQNRSGKNAEIFLKDFKGIHQCDGYSGYNGLYKKEGEILRAGCMDHARRKFYDVYKTSGKKAGLAKDVLNQLKLLYKIESGAKDKNLPPDKIKELRQKLSKPILEKLRKTLISKRDQVPQKSSLGKAIYYMLSQWDALTLYLDHGHIRISNSDAERIIKPFVIGRKNWLFNKTESGAKASAVIYSIIETCKANKINSYKYLSYILPKLKEIKDNTTNNPIVNLTDFKESVRNLLPYNINTELFRNTP